MPLDVDYVFAKEALEKIEKKLTNLPHGERGAIADKILQFAESLCEDRETPKGKSVDEWLVEQQSFYDSRLSDLPGVKYCKVISAPIAQLDRATAF